MRDQLLFHLTDTANGTLKDFLDENSFLRVHNLVIALLELAVDFNVLDVEDCVVRPSLLDSPQFRILDNKSNSL